MTIWLLVFLCACVRLCLHTLFVCFKSLSRLRSSHSTNLTARLVLSSMFIHSPRRENMQLSHMLYPRTCFGILWPINHMSSTSAQHTESLLEETNTTACHTVTTVCEYEVVCVVCIQRFLFQCLAPYQWVFPCVDTDVLLRAGGTCVLGLLLMQTESVFPFFHFVL